MSIVDNLNEEQKLPVLATEGAVLVTAGAGSGKTRLLTHRIAYLIAEKGVQPYNILAITFTNKAAREMRERVEKMIPNGNQIWVSTFHSLCVTILRKFIDRLGGYTKNFTIYADLEKNRVLKDIYKELGIEDEESKKSIDYHIGNIKNTNANLKAYCDNVSGYVDGKEVRAVYENYQKTLQSSNALDFDDLLVKTHLLLSQDAEVRAYYQDKFRYIHVDEFQDTNTIQYEIVRLLAGKWGNILVVGDEDQCIYGWRGANIQNIIDFKKDFPNTQIFKLQQNYRSTKKIISMANKVIDNNSQRLKKVLWTENEEGTDVAYYAGLTDRDEADFIAKTIRTAINNNGYKYSDFAVLIRLTAPSRLIEQYMLAYNIPYKMLGGFRFYERLEIKNVVAYLRAIVNPRDNESITRIINFPKRGIGDTSIEQLKQLANGGALLNPILNYFNYPLSAGLKTKLSNFANLYLDLRTNSESMKLSEFVKYLIKQAKIEESFDTNDTEEYNKLQNVREFVNAVTEFEESNPDASISEFLESITLTSDIDTVGEDEDYCLISTVHAVKGLEFNCVFIAALEEGLFPMNKCGGERPSDMEEERRLMYVAITRAKQKLFLSRSSQRYMYNQVKYQEPSRFLKELDLEQPTKPKRFAPVMADDYIIYDDIEPQQKISHSIKQSVAPTTTEKKDFSRFVNGTRVVHPKFGMGVIVDDSKLNINRMVTIDFGGIGNKTLSLDYAPLNIIK